MGQWETETTGPLSTYHVKWLRSCARQSWSNRDVKLTYFILQWPENMKPWVIAYSSVYRKGVQRIFSHFRIFLYLTLYFFPFFFSYFIFDFVVVFSVNGYRLRHLPKVTTHFTMVGGRRMERDGIEEEGSWSSCTSHSKGSSMIKRS